MQYPSIHLSIHWARWRWPAELIHTFTNDRANELKRRRQCVYWNQKELIFVYTDTKDISKDIYPLILLPFTSLPHLPPFLIFSAVPSHLPQFLSTLLFSSTTTLRVPFPSDIYCISLTSTLLLFTAFLFLFTRILLFFFFKPGFIISLPCFSGCLIIDRYKIKIKTH